MSSRPALSAYDQRLARSVLQAGHQLEKIWEAEKDRALKLLVVLKDLVALCETADAADLKRLVVYGNSLHQAMTAQHLTTILVPFERLLNRALRDDEFLISHTDSPKPLLERAPLVVIADHIRSAFNVGAILRTAECFAAEEVLLCGYTPPPDSEKTARTSMGAEAYVPWRSERDTQVAISELKARGYKIVALETAETADELGSFQWPEKTALLIGNERFGVDHASLRQADHIVRIALQGRKNSLNVGIALGIALADWHRVRAAATRLPEQVAAPSSAAHATPGENPHSLAPIGVFHAGARFPYEARRQGAVSEDSEMGCVELQVGCGFEQALEDLEGFSRIWLVYRFHHNRNWKPKVLPPRGPRQKRGVFATRAPYRPNHLGLSCVELVHVQGLKVFVRGFDLLDDSPIYDIKPYLPYADSFPDAKIGWLEGVEQGVHAVKFALRAEEQISWLEAHGVSQLRGFLKAQLEYEPLDQERKRVTPMNASADSVKSPKEPEPIADLYQIAYRTWRAQFIFAQDARSIEVTQISSGYSVMVSIPDDRYQDKALHLLFINKFK